MSSSFDWHSFSGEIREQEPLSKHTYYRIGGAADLLLTPRCEADLQLISKYINKTSTPYFILGLGSNLLVSDLGFQGVVIKTTKLNSKIEFNATHSELEVGCSVAISTLMRQAAENGWDGLEFLAGVPGSVGGAVFMNAGTHLGETKDRLTQVHAFDFKESRFQMFSNEELKFKYRKNLFLSESSIVYSTKWKVLLATPSATSGTTTADVKEKINAVLERRKKTQPIEFPSCGSVFKNPPNKPAWEIIDALGLRGKQIGGAQISTKHPNWIVNLGGAKASDVKSLIDEVKKLAMDQFGISMEEEVRILGNF